eukprot:c323_g1_i1 orf=541-2457(-)
MADEGNQIARDNGSRMEEDAANPQAEEPHPADSKPPMKFSFTVAKSSSSSRPPLFPKADRRKEADADTVKFVSEFDSTGGNPTQAPVKVIPLPEKSWRPEKRMKNIMVSSENLPSTEDRFESETLSAGPQPHVQYGLQLKRKPSDSAEETQNNSDVAMETVRDRDLQRCREDIGLLPDEMSVDEYENVPIEEFGEALLRGMGWEKGKPIGRNATTVTLPIEPVKRVGREGLGAIPAPQPEKVKKYIKPGESRKTKLTVGRIMCVITGTHIGSRGQIAEVNGNLYTVVLMESGKRVRVKEDELAEVGSSEEEKALKKLSGLHIGRHNDSEKSYDQSRRSDGRSSGEDSEVFTRESSDDRTKSGHRKDDRSRNKGKEDKHVNNGDDSRHRSRRDSTERNYGQERGSRDALENRYEGHKSRREEDRDSNDGKERYEATAGRQGRHGQGNESHRHETSMPDRKYEKDSRRADFRGDSSGSRHKEKGMFAKQEERKNSVSAKGGSLEEPVGDTVGHSNTRMQSWLAPDIRVRIIDRRAYGEKLYLQKACVVDVVSPSICDIQLDEGGRIIQKVKQEHLETALPKRGGRVLVVGGKHRGQVGKLQERDSDKGVGLVQMEENYEVLSFDLDNLAEFVGALHEMEG